MTYSLVPIQVKLASDTLIAQILLLEAGSEKGYREFKDDKGKAYRATDYDPQQKKRVQVPVRGNKLRQVEEDTKTIASLQEFKAIPPAFAKGLSLLASGAVLTGTLVTQVASDPEVRKRLGLVAGKFLGEIAQKLNQITINNPELDRKLGKILDGLGAELSKEYGDDQDPFVQAMRLGQSPSPAKDAPLLDRLAFELTKAKLLTHVLAEPEKYDASKAKRDADLKRLGHAALNILALLAIAAGPDIAYPLLSQMELPVLSGVLIRTEIHLMSIIKSWFIGAKVDELVFEPFVETLDIEDPKLNFLVRFGLSMIMTHYFYKFDVEGLIDHAGESLFHQAKAGAKSFTKTIGKTL